MTDEENVGFASELIKHLDTVGLSGDEALSIFGEGCALLIAAFCVSKNQDLHEITQFFEETLEKRVASHFEGMKKIHDR